MSTDREERDKSPFDYKLKEAGISPEEIHGYDREAATHMGVAAAVSGGDADAGMGIQSAARAMGLDFIEIDGKSMTLRFQSDFGFSTGTAFSGGFEKPGSLQREWRNSVAMGWQEPEKFYIYKKRGLDGSSCA